MTTFHNHPKTLAWYWSSEMIAKWKRTVLNHSKTLGWYWRSAMIAKWMRALLSVIQGHWLGIEVLKWLLSEWKHFSIMTLFGNISHQTHWLDIKVLKWLLSEGELFSISESKDTSLVLKFWNDCWVKENLPQSARDNGLVMKFWNYC